jgi:OOP family OmpA-OmpF porin
MPVEAGVLTLDNFGVCCMTLSNVIPKVLVAGGFGALGLLAPVAQADSSASGPEWSSVGPYIGAGASAARLDNAKIRDNDVSTGDLSDFDDDRATWQAYGGFMFTQWLGVEAGYLDVPEFKDGGFKVDGHGYTAAAVLAAPITDRVALYGKGGRVWWDVDASGPLGFDANVDGHDWFYGAGVRLGVLPNVSVRFEYARYELKGSDAKADLDLATAGIQYNF